MADGAVTFFLEKLNELLTHEVHLLYGVRRDIVWLRDELGTMRAFLADADKRKSSDSLVKVWVEQVREVVYDAEDILDEFMIRMEGQRGFFNKKLEAHIVGIQKDAEVLVRSLTNGHPKLEVISVVGMGGLGKTTLAKKVFNAEVIKRHFDCRSWVTVSQSFRQGPLMRAILSGMYDDRNELIPTMVDAMDDRRLQATLNFYLREKRCLLVLDDIWSEDVWNGLSVLLPDCDHGSRIVFTTRMSNVASSVQVESRLHNLQPLAEEEAWSLFCNRAFRKPDVKKINSELEEVGRLIVKNCEGLPLAIVAMGGLISKRAIEVGEWMKVLKSINWELANNPSLERVRSILSLSYKDLSPNLKYCFLYSCMFPEDYEIKQSLLIRVWMAEGFIAARQGLAMEEVAYEYLKELIERNLIQTAGLYLAGKFQSCRVHDVVLKLALSISRNEKFGSALTDLNTQFDDRTRRLSIHNYGETIPFLMSKSNLRTLLTFGLTKLPFSLPSILSNLTFLRVLDLKGIRELPKSVKNLCRLETLNAIGCNLESLPREISYLQNLTYLLVSRLKSPILEGIAALLASGKNVYFERFVSINTNVGGFTRLRAMKHVRIEGNFIEEIEKLSQLEKLNFQLANMEDGDKLWASIQKMKHLRSLAILSMNQDKPISIKSMPSAPPHLSQLWIHAALGKLPQWMCSLKSIKKLSLVSSTLTEDPLVALQSLPNLAELLLSKAYNGKKMGSDGIYGFPKLTHLAFENLEELEWWGGIQEGCMPLLQNLAISHCKKLTKLDESFIHLASLHFLHLGDMSDEFITRLRPNEGEDLYKVQQVKQIKLFYVNGGQLGCIDLK
ncbi:hypothetical protein AMTR_s00061p00152710 [Amborella trichopoda]|uniref:Uncharacterized protein n=1 Tax=Amborella trichopoda TaxID=13333 RepID=U5DCI4_AMBTC|nr:hypothetical protein AMTR_s00061p00152710 [Amborella trichopoda]